MIPYTQQKTRYAGINPWPIMVIAALTITAFINIGVLIQSQRLNTESVSKTPTLMQKITRKSAPQKTVFNLLVWC